MTIKSIWLRRIHKWVGLAIGVQFLIWAMSGAAMALLDMDEVAGGAMAEHAPAAVPSAGAAWPRIQATLAGQPVSKLAVRELASSAVYAVTVNGGVRLFDAASGAPLTVDHSLAQAIATAAYPGTANAIRVQSLSELSLAVRDHSLPIWKVDFSDAAKSSYYVSASTGEVLERRNETWRWWDFFWMLHNMDYAQRTSFNHPLIITVGIAMAWLAVTGSWLLFRTMWRHDLTGLVQRPAFKASCRGRDMKSD